MYFGGGYRAPAQTATFDAPSQNQNGKYNEDALPAMPSWNTAQSRRVEDEDVEMEKLNDQSGQQQSLLRNSGGRYYGNSPPKTYEEGDLGMTQAGPYHDYSQHQQFVASPTSTAAPSMYPPTYHTRPPSSVYDPHANPYEASIPPSYRTAPPSIAPTQQMGYGVGRKPVQGSWREV